MPGMGELIVILLIVLVVFGANKLPGIGDALGRSIKNFKKASNVDGDDDDDAKGKKNLKDKADKKELAAAKQSKQLDEGEEADGEWEEVVVRPSQEASLVRRRRVNPPPPLRGRCAQLRPRTAKRGAVDLSCMGAEQLRDGGIGRQLAKLLRAQRRRDPDPRRPAASTGSARAHA